MGVILGTTIQELRWRTAPSEKSLEQTIERGSNPAALKLMKELADQNNPNAEYWLGHMAEIGLGVPRDAKKAIEFYKMAADQNVVAAAARLGDIYLNGDSVPPDFSQAKSYLEQAAYHADPRSAMLLGQIYRGGLGTPVDQKEAYAWSEVASLEGSEFAKSERDSSLHDLDPSDQQAAFAHAKDIMKEIKQKTAVPLTPKN